MQILPQEEFISSLSELWWMAPYFLSFSLILMILHKCCYKHLCLNLVSPMELYACWGKRWWLIYLYFTHGILHHVLQQSVLNKYLLTEWKMKEHIQFRGLWIQTGFSFWQSNLIWIKFFLSKLITASKKEAVINLNGKKLLKINWKARNKDVFVEKRKFLWIFI